MAVDDIEIEKEKYCYNGIIKLKKAGVTLPYTKEQIEEIIKCRDDITYFIRNYVKIISLDKGLVLFSLYPFQEEMIETFKNNRFVICLLARQMGKTTTVAAYLLYEAIFNDNMRIAVLANKGDTAREILDRIKKMFEELPWFIKPGVVEWNKGSIKLANGSRIISASTSSSSIRGQSMNIIYLDELAFIQNDVEFFTSTYPVITSGKTTKVIITSTPNGMNLFYKLWSDAEKGRNNFIPKKYLWWHHPERDDKWKEATLKNISQKQFDQEFECVFFGSSDTLISGSKLQKLTFTNPIRQENSLNVYEEPKEGRNYVAVVDVSEGIGKDYSVVNIIDITDHPYKQIAVYRNNTVPPILFSEIVYRLCKQYNDAYCVVESNSVGKIVVDSLYYDYEYDNILASINKDNESIASNYSKTLGVRQTRKTKAIGCSSLKTMIESDTIIINDFMTVQELSTFIKKSNSYQAELGKTDDIVMTLVLFAWFATQPFFEELTDTDVRALIRENYMRLEENNHLVFGFYDDGISDEDGIEVIDYSRYVEY